MIFFGLKMNKIKNFEKNMILYNENIMTQLAYYLYTTESNVAFCYI